ncbi:TPA: hypothetical protein ACHW0W_000694 [Streptococcus equi subsp. zooepidemicus]
MAETFDYVTFAKNFEKRYGRPPTSEELEKGYNPFEGLPGKYVTGEESQAELERINASYKPSFGERLKDGLSFLGRNGFKAILIILQTPIYLTLFFFNLIKSTIGVFVIWFVSKFVLGWLVGIIAGLIYGFDLYKNPFPSPIKDIVDFSFGVNFFEDAVPNFFPHPVADAWIIGITIVFFALVMTFSKSEA